MPQTIIVPMGDPAGVGPEIAAAAACHDATRQLARVVIVGHAQCIANSLPVMKCSLPIHKIAADCSNYRADAVNVLHRDGLDMDALRMGSVQAQCGKAALDYIRTSVHCVQAGHGDAIATTPINKESFKAGGVPFIGHTEALAEMTGSHDPLTMFQVHDLRVFFLTRHLSLADACKAVKKARVLTYIQRCTEALQQLGIAHPRLVVAGLNPHCGEHGLFGLEEDQELTPAIQEAQADGYTVKGPDPADSVFYFAMQGKYDAVLSLYHDQGHIATKMVDFHRTISLTLGMPILRTSVDHGTAFDIAGKGLVNPVSMIEAIRLAALYAPNFKAFSPTKK